MPCMELLKFPTEVVLSIAQALDDADINRLLRTCKRLHSLLDPYLYRRVSRGPMSGIFLWACSPQPGECHTRRMCTVSKCITAGVDINTVWPYDNDDCSDWVGQYVECVRWTTPMCLAAGAGDTRLARLLLNAGADINLAACCGFPPIIIAIMAQEVEMVEFLIEHNVNLHVAGPDLAGPLATAVRSAKPGGGGCDSDDRIFHAVLKATDDVDESSHGGTTAVFEAVVMANSSALRALLDTGKADPDKIPSDMADCTPLMFACSSDLPYMVMILCEHSTANVNHVNETGESAFACAMENECWEVVMYLLKLGRVRLHDWDRWFTDVCEAGEDCAAPDEDDENVGNDAAAVDDWQPATRESVAREMIHRVDMTKQRAMVWTCIAEDCGLPELKSSIQAKLEEWEPVAGGIARV